jgi:NTE family protein
MLTIPVEEYKMKIRYRDATPLAVLFLLLACLLPAHAVAADSNDPAKARDGAKRPKICLVLSGGGARGAAHVGVIKVLEEYRIPIDCIAGTSMGALVGAAYASGMSVAEMQETNASITKELLFKERPPRQELSQRRKQEDYKIFVGPELGFKDGKLALPKGIVTGVQLETVLRRLSKLKGYHHFDDLPIPYRAVATDLVTGKAVVFSEGELANVMRASMSVPGAVAPAEFGGMMLVDGMLTQNLPVDAARAMGADIVIAVNVGTPLLKRDELTGVLGVLGQMLSILTEQNVEASIKSLKPSDILITPDLGDFSTGDFDHLSKIEPKGEEAARKLAQRLAQFSLPAAEYAALRQRQTVTVAADTRTVDEIRFNKLGRVNPKTAQAVMDTKDGRPLDQPKLDADMRRIYGTGDFEHVNYSLVEEQTRRILVVDAVEKSWGPNYLRFGIGLSSDFSGDAYFNVLASYRRTWLNSLGAEWRTDLQIGRTSSLASEFYQPLTADASLFIAPHVNYERRTTWLYQGDDRIASYDLDSTSVSIDVGSQFQRMGSLRIGALRGTLKPKLDSGPLTLTPGNSVIAQGAFTSHLILDQMDSVHFPRSGWRTAINVFDSVSYLGGEDQYAKWDVEGNFAHSFGEHTFNFYGKAGGKVGSDPLPRYDQFQWGGFLQGSGYRTGQFIGDNLKYGRAMYYHRIFRGSLLEGAYAGFSLEGTKIGNPLVPGNTDGFLKSAAVFIAADTPIGPAYLGYGRARDNQSSFYFYLGRPF